MGVGLQVPSGTPPPPPWTPPPSPLVTWHKTLKLVAGGPESPPAQPAKTTEWRAAEEGATGGAPVMPAENYIGPARKGPPVQSQETGTGFCTLTTLRRSAHAKSRQGSDVLEAELGGEGDLGPKTLCTKNGPIKFAYGKFRVFPGCFRWSAALPPSSCGAQPF